MMNRLIVQVFPLSFGVAIAALIRAFAGMIVVPFQFQVTFARLISLIETLMMTDVLVVIVALVGFGETKPIPEVAKQIVESARVMKKSFETEQIERTCMGYSTD